MEHDQPSANEVIQKHGLVGGFIRTLERYSLLGWFLFLFVLSGHFLIVIVGTLVPRPTVAVDSGGRVLGTFEYLKPHTRSDQEILDASMHFANCYLSLNSATIYEDYACAINMMGPKLATITKDSINQPTYDASGKKEEAYLVRVENAKARSWIEFAQDPTTGKQSGVSLVSRKDFDVVVRLQGNIVMDAGSGRISKPFDMTLNGEVVARNTKNTSGVQINDKRDN